MKKIFLGIFTSSLLLLGFSSAADLSTYTFEGFGHTYNFSSTTDTVSCLYTTPDGLHVFMCSQDRHTIESYDLTSPWDTTTMSYVSSTDVNYSSQALAGMSFASGGTKLYVSWVNGTIGQYDLSTPYDLSTISLVTTSDISAQASNIGGLFTKANGTKLYVLNYGDSTIYQYSLSTPYDLSTLSYDSVSYNVNTAIGAMYPGFSDISFSKNGTTLYVTDSVYSSSIYAFTLSTAWDITTASLTTSRNVATEDYRPSALSISSSGDHMLMI